MLFTMTSDKVSQDQSLELQSKIISYVREALSCNKGYLIFEVKNLETFEFDFYYSSGSEIVPRYDETREETISRILYTIDCAEFYDKHVSTESLNKIMSNLYNYVVGFLCSNVLYERYGIKDYSHLFKVEKKNV